MKATGEVMAIGRTYEEAIQKAIRSLDIGLHGFEYLEYTEDIHHIENFFCVGFFAHLF